MTRFTILGGRGFVGSHLAAYLSQNGVACWVPERDDPAIYAQPLGHVVYCIGVTADFRIRPREAVKAHVCHFLKLLEQADYDSLLYLSTTRVYKYAPETQEDQALAANPLLLDDLYNLSKLAGESLCLSGSGSPAIRVARLSNVYGPPYASPNFLDSLVRDLRLRQQVLFHSAAASSKDYIHISDLVSLLSQVAQQGRERIYNLASGVNTSHQAIAELLGQIGKGRVSFAPNAPVIQFAPINISRIQQEFGFNPQPFAARFGPELAAVLAGAD